MKEETPASGDKHDYMSQARYYWPDPKQANGKPYISRDGLSNPELEKLDRARLGKMSNSVITLSLAYYFSGEEKYARKATELIRVWFLDKPTRMNRTSTMHRQFQENIMIRVDVMALSILTHSLACSKPYLYLNNQKPLLQPTVNNSKIGSANSWNGC